MARLFVVDCVGFYDYPERKLAPDWGLATCHHFSDLDNPLPKNEAEALAEQWRARPETLLRHMLGGRYSRPKCILNQTRDLKSITTGKFAK